MPIVHEQGGQGRKGSTTVCGWREREKERERDRGTSIVFIAPPPYGADRKSSKNSGPQLFLMGALAGSEWGMAMNVVVCSMRGGGRGV